MLLCLIVHFGMKVAHLKHKDGETMCRFEFIRLRSAPGTRAEEIQEILSRISEIGPLSEAGAAPEGLQDIHVYENEDGTGDIGVTLVWQENVAASEAGMLGELLAEELRRYGLVDHTKWKERGRPECT